MNKIAIIYATLTGNATTVAEKLKALFANEADVYSIDDLKGIDQVKDYKYYILGTSTTGVGDLLEEWEDYLPSFETIDFTGKKAAIFGLGDSDSFGTSFVDAMRVLYDALKDKVTLVGFVSADDYNYDDSTAVIDGKFVGLALDEDNESEKTDDRLKAWVSELKKEFV